MFLCKVLVGESCNGKYDGVQPDERIKGKGVLYDSTVDDVRNPILWVTYHDGQAYPEYEVLFKVGPGSLYPR